jgi:hypothetical protein
MSKPKLHRWRISRIRGTPAEFIGPTSEGKPNEISKASQISDSETISQN